MNPTPEQQPAASPQFAEVVSYADVSETPGVLCLGTVAGSRPESATLTEIHDLPGTGWHGIAWSGHFKAGHLHRVHLTLKASGRTAFRLELNGTVTRYHRCFCDIDLATGAARSAEEMSTTTVEVRDGGYHDIVCTFVPQISASHWFYLLARDEDAISVESCEGTAFLIGKFELSVVISPIPGFRPLLHNPAIELDDGAVFALQSSLLLRNYFHLEFEIAFERGRKAVSIDLTANRQIACAVWMSGEESPQLSAPQSPTRAPSVAADTVSACGSQAPATGSVRLLPMPTGHALSSPALFDRYGPAFSSKGHAVWGLFSGWTDIQRETVEVSAKIPEFVLDFTCDDGSRTRVVLNNATLRRLVTLAQPSPDHLFWEMIAAAPPGRFLEVGGRGPRAATVRQRLNPAWTYVGFDVLPGENVTVVGDAHLLSSYFEKGSIDVVFADQVMEHLLAPWQFVVEANRVLRPGGLLCLITPSAAPLHAEPWDFYRFSDHSWVGMLNHMTGFEIIDRSVSAPMVVLPRVVLPGGERMQHGPAFMMTSVLARKIGETSVDWSGYHAGLAYGLYPGER